MQKILLIFSDKIDEQTKIKLSTVANQGKINIFLIST